MVPIFFSDRPIVYVHYMEIYCNKQDFDCSENCVAWLDINNVHNEKTLCRSE